MESSHFRFLLITVGVAMLLAEIRFSSAGMGCGPRDKSTRKPPTEEEEGVLSNNETEGCLPPSLDVMFVVDISRSIGPKQLLQAQETVRLLIQNLPVVPGSSRIGIIKYNIGAIEEIPLGKYETKEELLQQPMVIRDEILPGTRTDIAMNLMMKKLKASRIQDRPQVAILITDGKATSRAKDMNTMIGNLTTSGIKTVAIGVGRKVDNSELTTISGEDMGSGFVLHAKNYTELINLRSQLVFDMCDLLNMD